jgi:1-deoxy-D-xylulose-5-phosphate reductoisomerase
VLRERLAGSGIETAAGTAAVQAAADLDASWVMSAIVGAAGLAPTLAAARRGAIVALANKESLVCGGPGVLEVARKAGGTIIPVDSEHSAIFQVLQDPCRDKVRRLIRTWTYEAMRAATPEQAVAHPNWSMGAKISVDSATMMNKGLEMVEASYLFATPENQIDIVVHPQSIIHSMVEYTDGSTLAQLGPPDMRSPIACAWAWPDRLSWPAAPLDLAAIGQLTFEAPDLKRFPAIAIAREALRMGGHAPAAMNAANEVAVGAFLDRRIGFLDIAGSVQDTLDRLNGGWELGDQPGGDELEAAMIIDASARRVATEVVSRLAAVRAA